MPEEEITDPTILAQLDSAEVTDAALLAQLEGDELPLKKNNDSEVSSKNFFLTPSESQSQEPESKPVTILELAKQAGLSEEQINMLATATPKQMYDLDESLRKIGVPDKQRNEVIKLQGALQLEQQSLNKEKPIIPDKTKLSLPSFSGGLNIGRLYEPNYTTIQDVAIKNNTRPDEIAKIIGKDVAETGYGLTMAQTMDVEEALKSKSEGNKETGILGGLAIGTNKGLEKIYTSLSSVENILKSITGGNTKEINNFDYAADYYKKQSETYGKTKGLVPEAVEATTSMWGDLLGIALTPEIKILGGLVPKMATYFAADKFANTAGSLLKDNPKQLNIINESVKAGVVGLEDGFILHGLGIAAGNVSNAVYQASAKRFASTVAGIGSSAALFGGLSAAEGGAEKDIIANAMIGGVFGVPSIAGVLFSKAATNFEAATSEEIKKVQDIPISIEDLRKLEISLKEKSEAETNLENKQDLTVKANVISNMADVKAISNMVEQNPTEFKKSIETSDLMVEEKTAALEKIDNIVANSDNRIIESKDLETKITDLNGKIAEIDNNTAYSEVIKAELKKPIEEEIKTTQGQISEIFAQPKKAQETVDIKDIENKLLGKEPVKTEEVKPVTPEETTPTPKPPKEETTTPEVETPIKLSGDIRAEKKRKYDYTKGKKADTENVTFSDPNEADRYVVENTQNPAELIEIIERRGNEEKLIEGESKEEAIAKHLNKVKRGSYIRFGDKNNITMGKAKSYFNKTGEGIDQVAQAADMEFSGEDYYAGEQFVTTQDVIDFMDKYPNGVDQFKSSLKYDKISEDAKQKFNELTGFNPSPVAIETALEQIKIKLDLELEKKSDTFASEEQFTEWMDKPLTEEELIEYDKILEDEGRKTTTKETITGKENEAKSGEGSDGVQAKEKPTESAAEVKEPEVSTIETDIEKSKIEPVKGLFDKISEIKDDVKRVELEEKYTKANNERISNIEKNKKSKEVRDNIDEPPGDKNALKDGDVVVENSLLPKQAKENIKKWFKKQLSVAGNLPKVIFSSKISLQGRLKVRERQIEVDVNNLRKLVGKEWNKPTEQQLLLLNDVLHGQKPLTDLPVNMQQQVRQMRNNIDGLTREMVTSGLIDGELINTVSDNLGVYMNRSYRLHDDPKWYKNVPQDVINKAKNYINNSYSNLGVSLTPAEVDGLINHIVSDSKFDVSQIMTGRKLGSMDLSTLKKRKDIPVEIRDLMGEYKNPYVNYARTFAKMTHAIENAKFLKEVVDNTKGKYFFDKPTGEFSEAISSESSPTMKPLSGMFTSKEIKEEFDNMSAPATQSSFINTWMTINGIAKYGKTILSPITHVRNFTSNFLFHVANGHYRVGKMSDAVSLIKEDIFKNKDVSEQKLQRLIELGIVKESVSAGELHDVVNDAMTYKNNIEAFYESRAKKLLRKTLKVPEEAYRIEDDFHKIYAFYNELADLQRSYKGTDKTDFELEKMAAEKVRATMPTYSLVPRLIKNIRRMPLVGSFVSFPAEVFRTSFNTIELGLKELKNPKERVLGMKRLAGLTAALTLPGAIAQMSRQLSGVSDEEDDDLSRFLPPWSKNSQIVVVNKDLSKGVVTYVDASYSDPYNYLKRGLIAATRSDDPKKVGWEILKEYFKPFLSEEMMTQKMIDVSRNIDSQTGKKIYNEEDYIGEQVSAGFKHLWKGLEPGIVSQTKNLFDSDKDPKVEALSTFTGQRITKIDLGKSILYKGIDYAARKTDIKQIYNKVFFNEKTTEEQKEKAYIKSNELYKNLYESFNEDIDAAMRLGIDIEVIKQKLKDGGVGKAEIKKLMSGTFTPFEKQTSESEQGK